jgi:hypothetical protein
VKAHLNVHAKRLRLRDAASGKREREGAQSVRGRGGGPTSRIEMQPRFVSTHITAGGEARYHFCSDAIRFPLLLVKQTTPNQMSVRWCALAIPLYSRGWCVVFAHVEPAAYVVGTKSNAVRQYQPSFELHFCLLFPPFLLHCSAKHCEAAPQLGLQRTD